MDLQSAIRTICEHRNLSAEEMRSVMHTVMSGQATPAQIGGFLIGLSMKGETVEELTAAAEVMRTLATTVEVSGPHLVDTCGTGGDRARTFNISTASAFVAAAAGAKVAKHGNRSVSGRSGSADVLELAGARLALEPSQVAEAIDNLGIGFLFAPAHHRAMQYALEPRREVGTRTIFNLLGPLTNPARAPHQVLGVSDPVWLRPLAQVAGRLGGKHVLVVYAEDGTDELSIASETRIAELKDDGSVMSYTIAPESFGLSRASLSDLSVESTSESLDLIRKGLNNIPGPVSNVLALNAGAAIYAADLTDSLAEGVHKAQQVMAEGKARARFEAFLEFTKQHPP